MRVLILSVWLCLICENASASPAQLCDQAATRAAQESGVPEAVMLALTRTETGRRADGALQPWPWTVNMEGEGRWFETPREALSYVRERQRAGARSFDIGCFQINHLWHGEAFSSLEEMFDPILNARYAAQFLMSLRAELSPRQANWPRIAGAYHSRTPHFAKKYRTRFEKILRAGPYKIAEVDRGTQGGAGPLISNLRNGAATSSSGLVGGPRSPGGVGLALFQRGSGLFRFARSPLLERTN